MSCLFCGIIEGKVGAAAVFEDEISFAFLDTRPLLQGHTLLIPKVHVELLPELAADLVGPFFRNVQRLASAVEAAMGAEGVFVANNNRVSQSVPHLHVHVVPRRKGDGLKGFFWPRSKYASDEEMRAVATKIRARIV
jgi:histidine triad (HIT) family protein